MQRKIEGRKLLFVEDNEKFLGELTQYFSAANQTIAARTLKEAREILQNIRPDAVILDIILPDEEGLKLFQYVKNLPPVVILSSLNNDETILEGLELGATDYVTKPCSCEVLEARLALRLLPKEDAVINLNGIQLDLNNRTASFGEKQLALTGSEFNILHFLMAHPGRFFTSEVIYEAIWNAPSMQTTTVRRHLSTLRCKLKEITDANLIVTAFGKGYCMTIDNDQ